MCGGGGDDDGEDEAALCVVASPPAGPCVLLVGSLQVACHVWTLCPCQRVRVFVCAPGAHASLALPSASDAPR